MFTSYSANQGGDLRLGFFQDATCSVPSAYQAGYYEKLTGAEIPYTKASLVEKSCLSCSATEDEARNQQNYYNYNADGNRDSSVAKETNELCGALYATAGKCETAFDADAVPYPEEGACTYLEGVKRLQSDGILSSDQRRGSTPAAVVTGVLLGIAVLLGGYVYYLRHEIRRSRVNLVGANTSLT